MQFDKEMKANKEEVLLLIDNCMHHSDLSKRDFIQLEYFPPNFTFILQPLDQGIIRALK